MFVKIMFKEFKLLKAKCVQSYKLLNFQLFILSLERIKIGLLVNVSSNISSLFLKC